MTEPSGPAPRFRSIAVLNRGEAAVRFLTAASEWRAQRRCDLQMLLFHTDADRDTVAVRLADRAISIGAPDDPAGGSTGWQAYTDVDLLLRHLRLAGAEAVWLGWGFLSESAAFVEALEQEGIIALAPPSRAIRELGDKVSARAVASAVGVPTIAGSADAVADLRHALEISARVGYPVMVKSSAAGGGRGIRIATSPDDLEDAFVAAGREGESTTNDGRVFIEHAVEDAKHIEAQVAADEHGGVVVLGFRDCSVQRRRQKVVEETATLSAALRQRLTDDATALCNAVGYRGVGTVEFLVEPSGRHYFLEVNPRLQVEHPVTELTSGLDIVKLQLDLACGATVPPAPEHRGHAIEVRLNAEDTQRGFTPNAGKVVTWRPPYGPGVRVDTGFEVGSVVPPYYDSMVAKLLTWGSDRHEAVARMERALVECRLLLESGTSNRSLLGDVIGAPAFVDGTTNTTWLDRVLPTLHGVDERARAWCLLVATVELAERAQAVEVQRFVSPARRGRPPAELPGTHEVAFRYAGAGYSVQATQLTDRLLRVDDVEVETWRRDDGRRVVAIGGEQFAADVVWTPGAIIVEGDRGVVRCELDSPGRILSPGTGVVVHVTVTPGTRVEAGDGVAVVEAMKMETRVVSPISGVVRTVLASVGQPISAGDLLAVVDADDSAGEHPRAVGSSSLTGLRPAPSPTAWSIAELHRRTVAVLAGYEAAPGTFEGILERWAAPAPTDELVASGAAVLAIVVDVMSLGSRIPRWDVGERADFEDLLLLLRLDPHDWPQLPADFLARVERLLALTGGVDRDVSAPALARLWRAVVGQRRAIDVAAAVLTGWSDRAADRADEAVVDLLARLALVAGDEAPRLAELAHLERDRVLDRTASATASAGSCRPSSATSTISRRAGPTSTTSTARRARSRRPPMPASCASPTDARSSSRSSLAAGRSRRRRAPCWAAGPRRTGSSSSSTAPSRPRRPTMART